MMNSTQKKRVEEYARSVPSHYRGPWLTNWDNKCPCHVAVFNCAAHYCKDELRSSLGEEAQKA